eukprot:1365676-Amorphochlora_amoeboformis.AAC.1
MSSTSTCHVIAALIFLHEVATSTQEKGKTHLSTLGRVNWWNYDLNLLHVWQFFSSAKALSSAAASGSQHGTSSE